MGNRDLSDLVVTEILSGSERYNETGAWKHRSRRGCWALMLRLEGETVYEWKGGKVVSNPSQPILLSRGAVYDWVCREGGRFLDIEFDGPMITDELFGLRVGNVEEFRKHFREVVLRWNRKGANYRMECISILYDLLLRGLRNEEKVYIPTERRSKLQPALDHIAGSLDRRTDNDTLAGLCGMSTVYFRKLFTEIMGESPARFVKRQRIERAKEMLRSDYGSISEIAYSLGFSGIYDFSRSFKKETGLTPTGFSAGFAKRVEGSKVL